MPALLPPTPAMLAFFFVLGCVVGSFLNVCIYRLPRGGSIGEPPRSFCPRCGRMLAWQDNIPLVSFVLLRGRCRDCGRPISWRYPAVELLTGLVFPLIYYRQGLNVGAPVGEVIIMMLAVSMLIVAAGVDVEYLIIPDEVSLFGIIGGLLAGFLLPRLHVGPAAYQTFEGLTGHLHVDGLIGAAIGAVGGGLVVVLTAVVGYVMFQREAMGLGDAKLMAMVGAFFGWKVAVIGFLLAPFIGLLYGGTLLLMRDEHVMPYGPFLALTSGVAIIFRDVLTQFIEPAEYLVEALLG